MVRIGRASAIRGAAVFLVIVVIATLHYVTPSDLDYWHYIFQRLFYLPVIYAALYFGWRGGLATAIIAWVFYSPPFAGSWQNLPYYSLSQYLEVIVFCLAGILTGALADRGRRQRADLQRKTEELSRVYAELQANFERMKLSERLSATGQMAAGLAHEIRNPLAGIAGALGVLQRKRASESQQAECLQIISAECERLNRLLTGFLDFARPRRPRFQATDLDHLLESVVDLSSHAIDGKPITLRKQVEPGLPQLQCDPEQLKQAILNLILNAVQAMPEGGEILVAARLSGRHAVIEVRDQGCGIDPENMSRIFDPFFTTKESGTGLGLSVAHQIVGQLGGVLSVERNPDRGVTFSIVLPLEPVKE